MFKTIMLIHGAWLNADSWESFKAGTKLGATPSSPILAARRPLSGRATCIPKSRSRQGRHQGDHQSLRSPHPRAARAAHPDRTLVRRHHHAAPARPWARRRRRRHRPRADFRRAGRVADHRVDLPCVLFLGKLAPRHDHVAQVLQLALRTDRAAGTDRCHVRPLHRPYGRKIYWDGLASAAGKIRWNNPDRAPPLLIGGGIDLIAQAKMTKAMFEKQKKAPSKTELKIYPNRSHWTCIEPGWEEVADFALGWAPKNARAPSVRPLNASWPP